MRIDRAKWRARGNRSRRDAVNIDLAVHRAVRTVEGDGIKGICVWCDHYSLSGNELVPVEPPRARASPNRREVDASSLMDLSKIGHYQRPVGRLLSP